MVKCYFSFGVALSPCCLTECVRISVVVASFLIIKQQLQFKKSVGILSQHDTIRYNSSFDPCKR